MQRSSGMVRVLGFIAASVSIPVCHARATDDDNAADEPSESEHTSIGSNSDSKGESKSPPLRKAVSEGEKPDEQGRTFQHGGQFMIRVGPLMSYRIFSRYDASPLCHATDQTTGEPTKFCGFTAPPALDAGIGFAPLRFVEPFVWARFGLQSEDRTHTKPLVVFGAGARLYTVSDSAFKFFLEPAIGLELEKGEAGYQGEYKQDFLMHLVAGPQYDFAQAVGVYGDVGLTAGVLRAIHCWLEAQVGVQARFP
jgi:hypothetical protein